MGLPLSPAAGLHSALARLPGHAGFDGGGGAGREAARQAGRDLLAGALVDQLAAHIAYPITQKTDTAVRLAQLARAALVDAMAADVNESGAPALEHLPEWIEARA